MKIYSYRGKKNLSGDKIREARLKQRLSQSDLAAKVKKSSVKCEKYYWFLCSLFFTISILLFCAYSTTF